MGMANRAVDVGQLRGALGYCIVLGENVGISNKVTVLVATLGAFKTI